MSHVPDWNLARYRSLMNMSRQFKSLGDTIGPNDMTDSTICWRLASKYRKKAQEFRANTPEDERKDWPKAMSENSWINDVVMLCDKEDCGFMSGNVGEAWTHAKESGHSVSGPGPYEGTVLTVSIEKLEEEMASRVETWETDRNERQAKAFSMLRGADAVPPTEAPA